MINIIDLITSNSYLNAAVIFFFFFIAAKLLLAIFTKVLLRLASKTKTKVDDVIINKTKGPLSTILVLVGLRLALIPLHVNSAIDQIADNIANSLIIAIIAYSVIIVAIVIIEAWGSNVAKRTKSSLDENLLAMFRKFTAAIISLVGLIYILQLWGVQVGPLFASLGIAGIAIAFALQNTLGNIFGGVALIMDKAVKNGDIIKLDSGESGRIYQVGIRSTKIRTWDNELIIFPNGKLADSKIQNFNRPSLKQRVNVEFGVAYGSDPDKVKSIVKKEIGKMKILSKDEQVDVWFTSMADSSLNFKALFWVDSVFDRLGAYQDAITIIYNALKKNKITIPFPQREIWVHNLKK